MVWTIFGSLIWKWYFKPQVACWQLFIFISSTTFLKKHTYFLSTLYRVTDWNQSLEVFGVSLIIYFWNFQYKQSTVKILPRRLHFRFYRKFNCCWKISPEALFEEKEEIFISYSASALTYSYINFLHILLPLFCL